MKSRVSKSIETSDERGNGLHIASHLTHTLPVQRAYVTLQSFILLELFRPGSRHRRIQRCSQKLRPSFNTSWLFPNYPRQNLCCFTWFWHFSRLFRKTFHSVGLHHNYVDFCSSWSGATPADCSVTSSVRFKFEQLLGIGMIILLCIFLHPTIVILCPDCSLSKPFWM